MKVTVLAGGVGGARFLLGMRAAATGDEVRAIVNVGDDMWLAGLRITPDLDSILYALAGVNDTERGWGRVGESERVSAELAAWSVGWPWFTLGDLDLGTHIARTSWLREGLPLSTVVERLSERWPLGVRLLPASDDEVETQVIVSDPDAACTFRSGGPGIAPSCPRSASSYRGSRTRRPHPGSSMRSPTPTSS